MPQTGSMETCADIAFTRYHSGRDDGAPAPCSGAAMKRMLAILLFAGAASAETFTSTVVGMDCAACGPPIVRTLTAVEGVKNAKVDWKSQTATVELAPNFEKQKIRTALSNAGFESVLSGREAEGDPAAARRGRQDARHHPLPRRAPLDVASLLAPGKITIVDFYGGWCGPCSVLETRLELMGGHRTSPSAEPTSASGTTQPPSRPHATRAEALPYIRAYDASGKFIGSVTGGMWDEVLAMISKAAR